MVRPTFASRTLGYAQQGEEFCKQQPYKITSAYLSAENVVLEAISIEWNHLHTPCPQGRLLVDSVRFAPDN